ncbi:MAG: nicotinamide-nucleotide amidohydrolase family protein, partial [Chitinophagaceae bacterium]
LGPTNDDITKKVLCEYFHCSFKEDEQTLEHVKKIFSSRNIPMLESNLHQAQVPDCCTVIPNDYGTAPCMWFESKNIVYVSMPGVPHEMQGIMTDRVLPKLKESFTLPVILHRTIITMGLGESQVAERLISFEKSLPENIKLAYLPGNGFLKLRLTVLGDRQQTLSHELDQYSSVLKETLQDIVVIEDDISLETWIGEIARKNHLTISTAESCTGGLIAHKITSVPGSSAYYKGTVVSYSNEIKEKVLKVSLETLEKQGAVSEETVIAMVKGVTALLNTDLAVAVSGIMGPDGGTPEKPVGTVWIAAGSGNKINTHQYHLRYSRSRNMEMTANYALKMLGDAIIGTEKKI